MTVNKNNLVKIIFLIGSLVFLLAACGNKTLPVLTVTASPVAVATTQRPFIITATVSPSMQVAIPGPSRTLDPTQQARRSIYQTETADAKLREQLWNEKMTQVAQFPNVCDFSSFDSISPDGDWIALYCDKDQTMIVQNKQGAKWVLNFTDFLSPDSPEGMWGVLYPEFWSAEGQYLYFTIGLGYSGGGDDCFPVSARGDYGLFRLNIKTGVWVTMIPSTDAFPGYGIEFSPTGRRYAATINGMMITDLNTGEVINIDVSGVIQGFSWSPDGTHLAYSVASCGEDFSVESSSAYVWDALTDQTQTLVSTNEMVLRNVSWSNNWTIRVEGEKYISTNTLYTIYVYDISQGNLVFTGTATPSR